MYSERLLEEFYNPSNVGVIKGADAVGKVKDAVCGDIVKIYATIKNNTIVDAMFQTYGNVVTIAGTSVATKLIKDKTFEELLTITAEQLKAELGGVSKEKMASLRLVEDAIHALIVNYYKKINKELPEAYKFSNIINSDEIVVADEEEKVESQPKTRAKRTKAIKSIRAEVGDKDEDDEEDVDDEIEEDVVIEDNNPSGKNTITTEKKTIAVYSTNDINGIPELDNLNDSISDALKQLKDSNED